MIRRLVMPNNVSGTDKVIKWIVDNLTDNTYLNLMSQYTPIYKAFEYTEIARGITSAEYRQAVMWAQEAGLRNLDLQAYTF